MSQCVGSPAPRTWVERHPVAAELESRLPSVDLVARLLEIDPAALSDEETLEGVAGWERVGAWAAAEQARWVDELLARASSGIALERVPDEIATRLGVTRRVGQGKVELSAGLARYPRLARALHGGLISVRKAEVLIRETDHLALPDADAVLEAVLDTADERTVPQLRSDVRAAELALDAEAAAARHEAACRERCVRMTPAPDAMAWITALLPAADATTVMTALEAAAAHRETGDERDVDQRRADALTAMARRLLDSGLGPDGVPLPVRQHRRPHLLVTVAAGAGAPGVGAPAPARTDPSTTGPSPTSADLANLRDVAHLDGYGLVPLTAVAHLLGDAVPRVVRVDDEGLPLTCPPGTDGYRPNAELARAVIDRDRTCRFPGCRVPAHRCDIDHVTPFDPDRPARWQPVEPNLQVLCRHHHRLKTHGGWYASRDPVSGATFWRSPTGRVHIVSPDPLLPPPPPRARGPAA
ncbi:DUF222 domain-containing protein [Isoptericola sp. b490]|uniref:HNH endonuclease signature motif containing protein n=1 Tax=Actinotalea lenta TaxID=3064654 RepID=UPI002712661C|nr:HNH endonuclease signature motif containing protein [Isoptericola sp. b490]MDO8119837.1 DUF222 domain-containing protein [Isoptericola sp. b490]